MKKNRRWNVLLFGISAILFVFTKSVTAGELDTYDCAITDETDPSQITEFSKFNIGPQLDSSFELEILPAELSVKCGTLEMDSSQYIVCGYYNQGHRYQKLRTLWGYFGGFDILRKHGDRTFWIRCEYNR